MIQARLDSPSYVLLYPSGSRDIADITIPPNSMSRSPTNTNELPVIIMALVLIRAKYFDFLLSAALVLFRY